MTDGLDALPAGTYAAADEAFEAWDSFPRADRPGRDELEAALLAAAPLIRAAERERIRQLAIRHEAFYDAPCPDGVADCTRQDMPFVGLLDSEGASDAT